MRSTELKDHEYHSFYKPYLEVLGDVDLVEMLNRQSENFPQFIASIPDDKMNYAYDNGKWTIAEVLGHILDAERVFQYRALRIARGDKTPLAGFDQDAYVPQSGAANRSKDDFIKEYKAVRGSTIALFETLDDAALRQIGTASNVPMTAGALGFFCCGHQKHHRNIIRERYL